MRAAEPSLTAKRTAVARGEHRLLDAAPWVLDDPFALMLVGPEWRQIYDARAALHQERVRRDARAWVVARSRYAEDRLQQRPFTQYVILGAGLDSFAWRRPDLLHTLRVFEVDHPATQAWKRERIATLALPISDHHVFAPVDFETESIGNGLDAAGFDWSEPTMFSWLGVTAYLEVHAIETMLRSVASAIPASEIVLTYCPPESHLDEFSREFRQHHVAGGRRRRGAAEDHSVTSRREHAWWRDADCMSTTIPTTTTFTSATSQLGRTGSLLTTMNVSSRRPCPGELNNTTRPDRTRRFEAVSSTHVQPYPLLKASSTISRRTLGWGLVLGRCATSGCYMSVSSGGGGARCRRASARSVEASSRRWTVRRA